MHNAIDNSMLLASENNLALDDIINIQYTWGNTGFQKATFLAY